MRAIPSRPIESLEPDPRREGAVRIVIGGRTVLIVPLGAVEREGLAVGSSLGAGQVERLLIASDHEAAFRTAVRLLERRPFARRDLARRLGMKGHPPAAVDAALDRAAQAGYLDDERFARHFVQSRNARGRGPLRLRRELALHGVDPDLAERVLTEEIPAEASSDQMVALARKRARQLGELPRRDRIRRLLAFLARRGYKGPAAIKVVREVA